MSIFGENPRAMSRDALAMARRRIGVVHQDCRFLDHLPVSEPVSKNVLMPLAVAGRRAEGLAHLPGLLVWVGLAQAAGQLPPEPSGGERRRPALARAPASAGEAEVAAVLAALGAAPGVASARALAPEEGRALLEPWLGPGPPLENLPVPRLIEVALAEDGLDAEGLALRLQGAAPGAVLDDHGRWRAPLARAAGRLRGLIALALMALSTAAIVTLAAQVALAANAQVIGVLRLVGARDATIARAFVRRLTWRAGAGALAGTALGVGAVALLPQADPAGGFLAGLGFQGAGWLAPLLVPPFVAGVAFLATSMAARASLRALA